jgi:centrosomal CEP192-like protein
MTRREASQRTSIRLRAAVALLLATALVLGSVATSAPANQGAPPAQVAKKKTKKCKKKTKAGATAKKRKRCKKPGRRTRAPAKLAVSPTSHNFGMVPPMEHSPEKEFLVANNGESVSGPIFLSTAGAQAGDFLITNNTCNGLLLAPVKTCTFDVTFRPGVFGPRSGTLLVQATPGGAVSVPLSGFGGL